MGLNLNIDVKSEDEFNQQMQLYLAQGYSMQSNYNGTAILKKKSYSVGLLIVLLIFFFPAAIIYYLLAGDDIITIKNTSGQSSAQTATSSSTGEYVAYCEDCGHGLFKDSKFCPGCGKNVSENGVIPETKKCPDCGMELMEGAKFCPGCGKDLNEAQKNQCENCGAELTEDAKFCPECGEDLTDAKESEKVETAEIIEIEETTQEE